MHALVFRSWKHRVKGRDWYDFEWYVRNNVRLNLNHLQNRSVQFGSLGENILTQETFKQLLRERITKTSIELKKNDVRPFVRNPEDLEIWSTNYFLQLVDMIRFL